MKFKSLLKIGLPLLETTALAISLPLALTSCSDSKEESNQLPTFKVEKRDITPTLGEDNKLTESVDLTINVPENYLNKKDEEAKFTYEWEFKPISNANATLSSDDGWNKLNVNVQQPQENGDITLKINPVFFYNNGAFSNEFRLLVKENQKEVAVSESVEFTKPEKLVLSNVVDTTINNIDNFISNSKSIFGDALVGKEKELTQPNGIELTNENQNIGDVNKNNETSLFVKLANSLGIDKPDKEIASITLKLENENPGTKSNEEPKISLNVKLNENGAETDTSKANLWSSEVLLNDDGYTIDNYNSLTIDGLNAKLENEESIDLSDMGSKINSIVKSNLNAWSNSSSPNAEGMGTQILEALKADSSLSTIKDKLTSVSVELKDQNVGTKQTASVTITFDSNITLTGNVEGFAVSGNTLTSQNDFATNIDGTQQVGDAFFTIFKR